MKTIRHGLSIGIDRVNENIFLSMKAIGKLSHEDYETITPMLENALLGVKMPKVKVLFDATELDGWELRAAWDDFKLGLKLGSEFEKVAVYGNKGWLEMSTRIGGWFFPGEVKYFEEGDAALAWLVS